MTNDEVTRRIKGLFPDAFIDIAGENCNFELSVVSEGFAGKTLLQRQKAVLALFKSDITSGDIHAMSIIAKTPEETT